MPIYKPLEQTPDPGIQASVYDGTGLLFCVMGVYQRLTAFLLIFLVESRGEFRDGGCHPGSHTRGLATDCFGR